MGVSLVLLGQTIPNNSLVNFDDLLYVTNNDQPNNTNGQQTLICITDLVDCCETEELGDWYYPNGHTVMYNTDHKRATFQSNRGQNQLINNQQFYGSVRLWRRYTADERGLFYCELPDAENITQTLYVNICRFQKSLLYTVFKIICMLSAVFFNRTASNSISVAITPSGSTIAGETYSLTCSATLKANRNPPLPDPDIPSPIFEWFFGPNGNDSLSSGLTTPSTALSGGTYTSTLQFSPLSQPHAGNYTCRLGAGTLANSLNVTVNGIYSNN